MARLLPLDNSHLRVGLTLDDYLLLNDAGAFADYAKTELIDGEILYRNAQHRAHARIKSRLHIGLAAAFRDPGGLLEALVEGLIGIPPLHSPEPDIVVNGAGQRPHIRDA